MAGRGCVIRVQVSRNASSAEESSSQELVLPVALHSPLEVLKEQLQQITEIPIRQQVLILLDLSDPDRNSDTVLEDMDHVSLRNAGIRNNSVLTLHSLGVLKARSRSIQCNGAEKEKILTLRTNIDARRADHSYNGIIFNISSKGPYEVTIKSIWLAGMLGRVRVFSRSKSWDARENEPVTNSGHWWAYRENVSKQGWASVGDQFCAASWDRPVEIVLHTPVTLLPHQTMGFYCHSALPDDLGIQYQSYNKDAIVAEDEYIQISPGVGHTGSLPFDEVNGWYRAYRGPAGMFSYTVSLKGWNPWEHSIFPYHLKDSVRCMLLVNNRIHPRNALSRLPPFVVYHVLEFLHWDWFIETTYRSCEASSSSSSSEQVVNSRAPMPYSLRSSGHQVMNYLGAMMGAATGNMFEDDDDYEAFSEVLFFV